MDKASEALLALRPVSFQYKKEIDPAGTSQFGLLAEDVEKVNPDFRYALKGTSESLELFEIVLVLVGLDHVASFIVNADHSIM